MTALLIILSIILVFIVLIQWARVAEFGAKLRGEVVAMDENNNFNGNMSLIFMIVFLVACVVSAVYYKNVMLGYGPHEAASPHGRAIDNLFNTTLFFTGIVFVITHIALFWYAYKYRGRSGAKAFFFPHSTKLEIVWTAIPAIVMFGLVINGLLVWNSAMADIEPGEEYIEIEATGEQFGWTIRYPGEDGLLGERNFRLIDGINNLGQDWTDKKNLDDFKPNEIWLPKGKKVRVRITAKDVLHNFYLPQFRVKMDAIPGLPTYFVFIPDKTTEEYRQELRNYPEYQVLADPTDPDLGPKWKAFEYELACAELCGKGHFSMKKILKVVEPGEYEDWVLQQTSFYESQIQGTDNDPFKKDDVISPQIEAETSSEVISSLN